jgi:hypothetical protein
MERKSVVNLGCINIYIYSKIQLYFFSRGRSFLDMTRQPLMLNNPEPIQKIPSGHHYNALSCTKQDSFLYIMYAFYDVFPTYVITLYDA